MFQIIMKFILILFVILSALRIDLILGSPTDFNLYLDIETRFCGPLLAVEMAIICQGRYNDDERKYNFSIPSDVVILIIIYNSIIHWSKIIVHKNHFNSKINEL